MGIEDEEILEDTYGSGEHIRTVVLDFSEQQSAHFCYLHIRESGFLVNDLEQPTEKQVKLRIHLSEVSELLEDIKSRDRNFWILGHLLSMTLNR